MVESTAVQLGKKMAVKMVELLAGWMVVQKAVWMVE